MLVLAPPFIPAFFGLRFNNMLKSSYSEKRRVEYNANELSKPLMNTACSKCR